MSAVPCDASVIPALEPVPAVVMVTPGTCSRYAATQARIAGSSRVLPVSFSRTAVDDPPAAPAAVPLAVAVPHAASAGSSAAAITIKPIRPLPAIVGRTS